MGEFLSSRHHFTHYFLLFNIFFTVLGEIFFYFPLSPWIFHFCGLFSLIHVTFTHFPVFWLIFYQQMGELLLFFICFAHVQTFVWMELLLSQVNIPPVRFFIQKIRVSKGGTQLNGCQIAQGQDCFCDFGRKLKNLSLPSMHSDLLPWMPAESHEWKNCTKPLIFSSFVQSPKKMTDCLLC